MTFFDWLRTFLANASWWFTVRPWEQAVRLTRGKNRELLGPGLYFKVPVIHQAIIYPIRLRTVYVPMQTLRSGDGRTVSIGLILKYKIADLARVLDSLHNPEGTLGHLAQGAIADLLPTIRAAEATATKLREAVGAVINPEKYGIAEFEVLVSDNADLSQRTFRLIQEGRYFNADGEIDRMARTS